MHFKVHPKAAPSVRLGDFDITHASTEHYSTQAEMHERNKTESQAQRMRQHLAYYSATGERTYDLPRVLDDRSVYYHRQFGVKTTIHNYTTRPLLVMERVGIPIVIQPERRLSGHPEACVIIRVERHFDSDKTCRDVYDLINTTGAAHGAEIKAIQPLLIKNAGQYKFGRKIAIEYKLLESDLDNDNQTLYHHRTDLLLSFLIGDAGVVHPHSPQNVVSGQISHANYDMSDDNLRVIIRYFTNDPKATPLYIRVANKTFAIQPEASTCDRLVDVSRKEKNETTRYEEVSEYVEIFYPTRCEIKGADANGYRCSRVSLQQATDYYGIHATPEEAANAAVTSESKIRLLKEQVELLKNEQARKTQSLQTEIDELKIANGAVKRELDEARKENSVVVEELKLKREDQNHHQRMNLESFKFTATVATSLLAMIPLVIKLYQMRTKENQ